jgi:ribonuclease P protein component
MLSQRRRLRTSADFQAVMKSGRKIRRQTLILHAVKSDTPRFGVIAGKSLGSAVQRNRTKRILRHAAAEMMMEPPFMDVVVRALPHSGDLRGDLSSAWAQVKKEET